MLIKNLSSLLGFPHSKKFFYNIVGQNFQNADYLFTNFISEVDKNSNDKYKIPDNFAKIDELIISNTLVYEVYKKNN